MLAPPSDYGYNPSSANPMNYNQQHVQSHERPKLFMQLPLLGDYSHLIHPGPHPVMTPKYESESLEMTGPSHSQYYPSSHVATSMLHVSSDYDYPHPNNLTPSSARSSSKRSREDLNLKEKKRMFKLNDRINQLKDMLEDAGVQTKKNKQSILDNAAHYIEMLRSNLVIAKQKAERAEKQAEAFRSQAQTASSRADQVLRGIFQKTTTPRVVVDISLETVTFNAAFVTHTGQLASVLKQQKTLQSYLGADKETLHKMMHKVCETNQSITAVVNMPVAGGTVEAVNLVAAVITDNKGKATNIEFSLIPLEVVQPQSSGEVHDDAETSAEESVTDGETKDKL